MTKGEEENPETKNYSTVGCTVLAQKMMDIHLLQDF